MAPPSTKELLARVQTLPSPPVAIEALWDGDSDGWFIRLNAVWCDVGGHEWTTWRLFTRGTDIRLFRGEVPPWPEAVEAQAVGGELARELGVPFWFPSPDHPEDDCPHWWERAQASPCSRCAVPLFHVSGAARDPLLCHFCWIRWESERKEALVPPQQRSWPHCWICSARTLGRWGDVPRCERCDAKYESYPCPECGQEIMSERAAGRKARCSGCVTRGQIASLSGAELDELRDLLRTGGPLPMIIRARELLGTGLSEAQNIMFVLREEANAGGDGSGDAAAGEGVALRR